MSLTVQAQFGNSCNIAVIKKIDEKYKKTNFKIGKDSRFKEYSSTNIGQSTSTLLLGSGKTGSISINNQKIDIKCTHISNSNYDLEISINGDAGGVSTSISLSRNQQTNIGEIVQDLNDKSKEKDITSGYSKSKSKRKNYYQYFVTIR